jgi:hypothetical protein
MVAAGMAGTFILCAIFGSTARSAPRMIVLEPWQETPAKFLGASNCAGPACHGRPAATESKRSQQTEFTTWNEKDDHRQAYATLTNEHSLQIARHLKLDKPPHESARCLNCHSMNVLDPARRGRDFLLEDGVSCDGCHGPAERWLGSHHNEPYDQSLAKGMKDIRNPIVRAEMCMSCHIGDHADAKIVDHEMLAAGHPRLTFELESFSSNMPPHWREKIPDDGTVPRAQLWATGQVVGLRVAAQLLARDAGHGRWPEYSHFDCASCHHDLKEDGWRQIAPRLGRPGRPHWWARPGANLVRELAAEGPVELAIETLNRQFALAPFGRESEVAANADDLESQLRELADSIAVRPVTPGDARKLAVSLCDAAPTTAWHGPAAARELAVALRALLSSLDPDSAAVLKADKLTSELKDPAAASRYDPQAFVSRVKEIRQQL